MSSSGSLKLLLRRLLLTLFFALLAILAFFSWQHFFPVTTAAGWTSKVYLDNVPMVSALAKDDHGVLHFTLEHHKLGGSVVRQRPDGSLEEVMAGLEKPDGLLRYRDGLLVSQESADSPLLWLHGGQVEKLLTGKDIEGIDSYAKFIYAIEDLKSDGHLLQYDPLTANTVTLRGGLVEAEGVAVCPDGRLFYSEKKKGWVKQYRQGADEDPVIHDGLNAPGFLMCNEEGIWIAEDATHGARLLLADALGKLHVVLKHMRSVQSVLSLAPGRLLVAEQGRNRILEITRIPNDSK